MKRCILLLTFVVLGTSACTLPVDQLGDKSDPVTFTGYTANAGLEIEVICETQDWYPSFTNAASMGTIVSSDQILEQDGQQAYYFEATMTIPDECWFDNHTERWTAMVRMTDVASGRVHEHFQEHSGYPCLVQEYFSGAGPHDIFQTCGHHGHSYLVVMADY